jgi:hypothetical protein
MPRTVKRFPRGRWIRPGFGDVPTCHEKFKLEGNDVLSIAFSPFGNRLAAGGANGGGVKIFNATIGKQVGVLEGLPGDDVVFGISDSPDGQTLTTATLDRQANHGNDAKGHQNWQRSNNHSMRFKPPMVTRRFKRSSVRSGVSGFHQHGPPNNKAQGTGPPGVMHDRSTKRRGGPGPRQREVRWRHQAGPRHDASRSQTRPEPTPPPMPAEIGTSAHRSSPARWPTAPIAAPAANPETIRGHGDGSRET